MLYVIMGPSASGKTTLVQKAGFKRVVTTTSRPMREGEADGVDYYFVTEDEFKRRVSQGKFMEYTCYAGNFYGTQLDRIKEAVNSNDPHYCVVDIVGARTFKEEYGSQIKAILIYATREEITKRLVSRKESADSMKARLAQYDEEMQVNLEICDVALNTTYNSVEDTLKLLRRLL